MFKQTPKKRVLFVRRLTPVLLVVFGVFSLAFVNLHAPKMALAATANTINFQARLQTAAGGIVPDGNYNVEFKLYSASSGGSAIWTEDYLNGASQGLKAVNGYITTNLGSLNAFSGINWDQQLWLTMNIGGTVTSGTYPSIGDGEMNPRLPLTAVPYAFSAGQLDNTATGGRSTLSFQGSASGHGDQNFVIQDQGAGGTYNLLTQNQANSSYLQLQGGTPGTAQTGNFNISGTGVAATLQATNFDTASAVALNLGTTNATSIVLKQNTSLASGKTLTINGSGFDASGNLGIGNTSPGASLDVKGSTSDLSASALNVQNSLGGSLINARNDGQITIGTNASSGTSTTFGSSLTTTADSSDSGYFIANKYMTGANPGALTSISIYVNGIDPTAANDKYRLAIYADGGANKPTTLIAQSAEGTLVANSFNTLPVTASLGASTTYWLVYETNGSGGTYNNFSYSVGTANQYYAYSMAYGAFPSTAGTGGSNGAVAIAMYGTYTEAGTATTPALTVAANGNVGIGTSTPSYSLTVQGTAAATTLIQNGNTVCDSSSNCNNYLQIQGSTPGTAQTGNINLNGKAIVSDLQTNFIDNNGATLTINNAANTGGQVALTVNGGISLQGVNSANRATFTSPGSFTTYGAISIAPVAYGSGQSAILIGLTSAASSGSSGIEVFDARTSGHNPTIEVASPNESQGFGLSWDGSNTLALLKSSSNSVALQANGINVLTATNNSGVGLATVSGGFQSGSSNQFQIDASGNLVTTGTVTVNTTSTTAFSVQNASSVSLFNVDTSTGTITLGSAASGNYITFTAAGGLVASGTTQHVKKILLTPEFAGAVLDTSGDATACGSANNGTMTSAYDGTNRMNNYNWTSTSGTAQCYDVVVQVPIPSDFGSWNGTPNIQMKKDSTGTGAYALQIIPSSGNDANYGSGSTFVTPGTLTTSWGNMATSSLSGTYTAGDYLTIKIRLTSTSGANVKLGNITLSYNSKY